MSSQMPKEFLTLFHFKGIISLSHLDEQCFLQEPKTHHRAWAEAGDQLCLRCSLITDYCDCPWLPLRGWREVSIARDTMPFRTDLNASSLRTTFHGTRSSYARFQINQPSYPAITPMDHNNDWLCFLVMSEATPLKAHQHDCLSMTEQGQQQRCQHGWDKDHEASNLNKELRKTKECWVGEMVCPREEQLADTKWSILQIYI